MSIVSPAMQGAVTRIDLAKDFSAFPFGRYRATGDFSGERFRDEFLAPALRRGTVEVDLDGARGLSPSFLEEAFGGLVRRNGFSVRELRERLKVRSERDPSFERLVESYISDARA